MTAPEIAPLRRQAAHVLKHHAGPGADAVALAAAAARAYDDLARVLAPLIGEAGIEALTARAVHVTQRDYPWLAKTNDSDHARRPFAQVVFYLEQQHAALATEAAVAVLATFTGLLATFVGESLTMRLMRQAWPDGFPDAGTEETRT